MSFLTTSFIGSFLFAQLLFPPAPYQVSIDRWQPKSGDRIVIDTQVNEGYLIHSDGEYVQFPVITGQRRWVYYIGRGYNATTPTWDWVMQSKDIKGDRITFGPSGRFLRLYKDGQTHTAYGFHEHAAEEVMFGRESRFQSMGCVIVRTQIMDILEQTFDLNESTGVPVFTRYGVEAPVAVAFGV